MDKYEEAALATANKARSTVGLPPVDHLYKGQKETSDSCAITNTIYDDDMDMEIYEVRTDYSASYPTPDNVEPGYISIIRYDDKGRPELIFQEEPDELTHRFLEKFDQGEYPDLEV